MIRQEGVERVPYVQLQIVMQDEVDAPVLDQLSVFPIKVMGHVHIGAQTFVL